MTRDEQNAEFAGWYATHVARRRRLQVDKVQRAFILQGVNEKVAHKLAVLAVDALFVD